MNIQIKSFHIFNKKINIPIFIIEFLFCVKKLFKYRITYNMKI